MWLYGCICITSSRSHVISHPPYRPGSELMYGFAEFAASLNEPEEGVAPTDSRLRPDQRIMEEQDFNRANEEKVDITVLPPHLSKIISWCI